MKHGIKISITEENSSMYVSDTTLVTEKYQAFWTIANAVGLKRFTQHGERFFLAEQAALAMEVARLHAFALGTGSIDNAVKA